MKQHFQYLRYVIRHKWFVFIEACKLGIPWLGIIHDWSKFLPSEWFPYVLKFYGGEVTQIVDVAFDISCMFHYHRNKHHWNHWVLSKSDGTITAVDMPMKYRLEMLADWRGAGKAQGFVDVLAWYMKNKGKMLLHQDTRKWIEEQLEV